MRWKSIIQTGVLIGGFPALLLSFGPVLGAQEDTSESNPPPSSKPSVLTETVTEADVGITYEPPGDDLTPTISAEKALGIAWANGGVSGRPTSSSIVFALLSDQYFGEHKAMPVWVVTYEGACVPNLGPQGNGGSNCLDSEWHVLIDAETGTWVGSYASR